MIRLCRDAASKWIAASSAIGATVREVLRTIVSFVDSSTGASHPRYPITLERIAAHLGRHVATVCRALRVLEVLGLVVRRRMPPRRQSDGTWRQLPTDYELRLPESCWREVRPVADTVIAREVATYAPRIDDAPTHEDAFDGELTDDDRVTLCVRGTVKVPQDKPGSWDVAGFDDRTIPGDEVSAEDLARQIVDAGSLALARVSDDRRFVAMNAIHELRQRAREVALTICHHGLTAARGCGVVRQWVDDALGNAHQLIHSAAHALNILRTFIVGAANESKRAHDAARERGRARHYAQFDEPVSSSGIMVNRV
ncbi:MAG: hypothetical protein E6Q97_05800 [Desulfurellales bacterium]|nr:MAG: hypothetical protein E6Q97_05800 [Desulfurellales bacterium]